MKKFFLVSILCALTALCSLGSCSRSVSTDIDKSMQNSSSYENDDFLAENRSESETNDASAENSQEESENSSENSLENSSEIVSESTAEDDSETVSDRTSESDSETVSESTSEDDSDSSWTEEKDDLATSGHVFSRAPENYGTDNVLTVQNDYLSADSTASLKGVFNIEGAPVYQEYMIWTWAEFRLQETLGTAQNVRNKAFVYDVKTENCNDISSVILVSSDGKRTDEVSFNIANPSASNSTICCQALSDGWYRITVNFYMTYFYDPILENTADILIMFSNQNQDPYQDSVFYIDNAKIIDVDNVEESVDITVYNPDTYYDETECLQIKIVGNSFVSSSCSAYFLQQFLDEAGANATVDYLSIPNGRIPDQYEYAFGANGYMETEKIDVLFVQDFYSLSDCEALEEFLTSLYALSPTTELKIYPGENETADGLRASMLYGVDFVDWKGVIKTLKSTHGFTAEHLNAFDGWHPNELSGFIGGLMMYADLYGKHPDFQTVTALAEQVWFYLPGTTDDEKTDSLTIIYDLALSLILND